MSSLFTLRHAGALAALAGALAAAPSLTSTADARVPGVGNGLPVDTVGPDLRSVTIIDADLTGTADEVARFCFDRAVESVPSDGDGYRIRSYDATRWWDARRAVRNINGDVRCVDASFASGFDISQGTIGEITKPTAATASDASRAVPASEPLAGSVVTAAAGASSAPDLIGAQIVADRIRFEFDEPVDPATVALVAAKFRVEDADAGYPAATFVEASGKNVSASFGAYDITKARGAYVEAGAVRDRAHSSGAPAYTVAQPRYATLGGGAAGGNRPASAAWVGPTTLEIKYALGVNTIATVNRDEFTLLREDGATTTPISDPVVISGTTVRLNFADVIGEQRDAWVAVSSSPVAASLAGGSNTRYTAGATLALGTAPSAPGRTSGPDLLSASFDEARALLTYRFDEGVKTAGPANAFSALLSDRSVFAASPGVSQGTASPLVVVNQEPTVTAANALGASISGLTGSVAAADVYATPSPSSAISFLVEQAPVLPAAPATPATPIAAPAPPLPGVNFTLVRKKLKKTKKQKYVVKYSGRLTSTSAGCIGKRSITFEARRKSGTVKSLGKATSNSRGAFALALKKRPKGRVYAIVAATPTCAGTTLGGIAA